MKHLLFLLLLALASPGATAQGVRFEELSLDAALAKAKQENKYLFIDCYTNWCGPCKLMDRDLFPLEAAGDYFNPRFVSVKYEMEKSADGLALGKRFGIKAYPTFVILNGDNELVHIFAGGILDLSFLDKVAECFDDDKALGPLRRRLDAGEMNAFINDREPVDLLHAPDTSGALPATGRDTKLVAAYLKALQATYTRDIAALADTCWNALTDEERCRPECLFLVDDLAPLESARARYLFDHLDRYRAAAGREAIDEIVKKKYIERYTRLIRGERRATADEITRAREHVHALALVKADVLTLYDSALALKNGQLAVAAFLPEIHRLFPAITPGEGDMFLYTLVSYTRSSWETTQLEELIRLSSDRVQEYIRKAARL
ncbi:MAG: thioredoxin family protein [Odoribacteraceae bacterium]|jgi:thioredoxin-related protein|nr:thioredoxin family protein [Odoribacteraceae bacterium]